VGDKLTQKGRGQGRMTLLLLSALCCRRYVIIVYMNCRPPTVSRQTPTAASHLHALSAHEANGTDTPVTSESKGTDTLSTLERNVKYTLSTFCPNGIVTLSTFQPRDSDVLSTSECSGDGTLSSNQPVTPLSPSKGHGTLTASQSNGAVTPVRSHAVPSSVSATVTRQVLHITLKLPVTDARNDLP